jgi:hypothetical protein
VVCPVGFLTNVRAILDFVVLEPNLNITDSRLLKFLKKLKFGGPYLLTGKYNMSPFLNIWPVFNYGAVLSYPERL